MGENKFWQRPLTPLEKEELDVELIEELNEGVGEIRERNPWRKKVVSLFVLLTFIFLIFYNLITLINLPALDFLETSWELVRRPEIRVLREAVVKVKVPGGRGTGFNIDEDGLIITNYHVIAGKRDIRVSFSGQVEHRGEALETFPEIDLAVVDIKGDNLPVLEIVERELTVGEEVIIIGNPLGLFKVPTKGVIIGETTLEGWNEAVLLIKGPVYKGSSGSPVFDMEGKVVAIIFAVFKGKEEIVGLAVPVEVLTKNWDK